MAAAQNLPPINAETNPTMTTSWPVRYRPGTSKEWENVIDHLSTSAKLINYVFVAWQKPTVFTTPLQAIRCRYKSWPQTQGYRESHYPALNVGLPQPGLKSWTTETDSAIWQSFLHQIRISHFCRTFTFYTCVFTFCTNQLSTIMQ